MKVFVTGANGYIGSSLSIGMAERGHNVLAISRRAMLHKQLPPTLLQAQTPITKESLCHLLAEQRPQVLVHCVGSSTVWQAQNAPYQDYINTVSSAAEMLEAIRQNSKDTLFVLISSASVYGDQDENRYAEISNLKPISVYAYNKMIAELLTQEYASQFDIQTLIVRPFSVYGNDLRKQVIFDICNKLLTKPEVLQLDGTGDEVRDFLHINDLVEGIAHLLDKRCTGIVNFGTGRPTRLDELASFLIGHLSPVSRISFSGKSSAYNPKTMLADVTHATCLGVTSRVTLEDGLRRVCDEYKDGFRSSQ